MPPKYKPTREHKRKVRARNQDASTATTTSDSNTAIIVPESKDEKEERRQALRFELRAQQSKPSAKKQKRLDKYIDKKLKKEESLDLLKKLAAEKDKHNTTGLQSSKNLNVKKRSFSEYVNGQVMSHANVQPKSIDSKTTRRSKDSTGKHQEDTESEDSFEGDHPEAFEDREEPNTDDTWMKKRAAPQQGTGLAQPLVIGPDGMPIIPRRADKRRKEEPQTMKQENAITANEEIIEVPWEGFSDIDEDETSTDDSEQADGDIDPRLKHIDANVLDALLQELERSDDQDSEESDLETDSEEEKSAADNSSSVGDDTVEDDASKDTSDDSSDNTSTSSTHANDFRIKPRVSAFKSWATQQLNTSLGHVPSYDQPITELSADNHAPVKPAAGFTIGVKQINAPASTRFAYNVHVERPPHIVESRSQLPILQREQEIMEAIYNNPVVVVKGDTGSGKTTQLPQFLFEAGFGDKDSPTPGMIGITQPRRVAAVSMAKRVGEELGEHGTKVAHQIRFDSTVSSSTAIKFMTDGILLRELSQDLLLRKYSAIVIDEAHERSVNTDLLIGMLSKIVPARMRKTEQNPDPKPLRLIIMSATLNIDDFLHHKLFPEALRPPIVEAEGRQHRVTTHFALRSRPDYVEETIEKVKRAHKKLPPGGILVFLTGQNEIKLVLDRLKKELNGSLAPHDSTPRMRISANDAPLEMDDVDLGIPTKRSDIKHAADDTDEDIEFVTHEDQIDKEFDISDNEKEDAHTSTLSATADRNPYDTAHLLPLYSQLPTKDQLRIFELPPDRARLIVLATNVAETSLTIPGIKYVFDCGRSKERKYNVSTNVQSFEIDYISKASAQQRAGRAGRTGPGHCWRLYSSAVYEQFFPDHAEPEILRTPAESIVLQLKSFGYPKPVVEFPFPSAPDANTLVKADRLLSYIGAVANGVLTTIGKGLAAYPLSPRLGKILVSAIETPNVLSEVLAIAAALSVDDIFINQSQATNHEDGDHEADSVKQAYGRAHASFTKNDKASDILKTLTAVSSYMAASNKETFCQQNFVRLKALAEISQLYGQLRSLVQANNPSIVLKDKLPRTKLDHALCATINSNVASGFIDQVALRYDLHPTPPVLPRQPTRAIDVPYLPLTPINAKSAELVDKAVFIHPSSSISRINVKSLPQYVVYRHLQTSQQHTVGDTTTTKAKTRMIPLTSLDANSLLSLIRDTGLIRYGKPVPNTKIEEVSNTRPKERVCWVSTEVRGEEGAGAFGWPLPPSKVRQVMDLKASSGWRVAQVIA